MTRNNSNEIKTSKRPYAFLLFGFFLCGMVAAASHPGQGLFSGDSGDGLLMMVLLQAILMLGVSTVYFMTGGLVFLISRVRSTQ